MDDSRPIDHTGIGEDKVCRLSWRTATEQQQGTEDDQENFIRVRYTVLPYSASVRTRGVHGSCRPNHWNRRRISNY
jgi:hypothetical protein